MDASFVRRWVPELSDVPAAQLAAPGDGYHEPIVDHAVERRRTLAAYRAARS